jgi:hypothetical protein
MTTTTTTLSRVLRGCVATCLKKDLKKLSKPYAAFSLDWSRETGLAKALRFQPSQKAPEGSELLCAICKEAFGEAGQENAVHLLFWALSTSAHGQEGLPFGTDDACYAFVCAFFESLMTDEEKASLALQATRVVYEARESSIPDAALSELLRRDLQGKPPYRTFRKKFASLVKRCKAEDADGEELFALFEQSRVRMALKITANMPRPEVAGSTNIVGINEFRKSGGP